MIGILALADEPVFHVTAMLPPGFSRLALERSIREWAARVDSFYLGRNWAKMSRKRMRGAVFFETRGNTHAHLVVSPPHGASSLHFLFNANLWFGHPVARILRRASPKPVMDRGRMKVQRIQPGEVERVLKYDTKEMEYRPSAVGDWKFLADLSGS